MRNPERLNQFYDDFKLLHQNCFPDWRFGQLCSNFFGWLASTKHADPFFPEESRMLEYLHEYCVRVYCLR